MRSNRNRNYYYVATASPYVEEKLGVLVKYEYLRDARKKVRSQAGDVYKVRIAPDSGDVISLEKIY